MKRQYHIRILDPVRAARFGDIIPSGRVPVKSLQTEIVKLPDGDGHTVAEVYFLDTTALSQEQTDLLRQRIGEVFGMTEAESRRELAINGMPIWAVGTELLLPF